MTHDEYLQHLEGLNPLHRFWHRLLEAYAVALCRIMARVSGRDSS